MRLVAVAVQGGETAALRRLKYYLWDSNLVAKYFDIRNGMLGGDYSTKVTPCSFSTMFGSDRALRKRAAEM
jgi:hypothetical protein